MLKNIFKNKSKSVYSSPEISSLAIEAPLDIYIIGNGPSLNTTPHTTLSDKFTIGTNRSWLWGATNILMWRDSRITEELQFFQTPKNDTLWIAGEPALLNTSLPVSDTMRDSIDFHFSDTWKDEYIGTGIKWNGIIFHALAMAKHLNPSARIHLLGVDLGVQSDMHHFFNIYKGFDQGFYKSAWEPDSFNYQKRLDMMLQNFNKLNKRGFEIINHSKESRLADLFGYEAL